MAQFKFLNEINGISKVDGPLTKGPLPRWERKRLENSLSNNSSLNLTKGKSLSLSMNDVSEPRLLKTPSKTPGKKKGSATPTPNKNMKTPSSDRFIPLRSASNFELGHYKLLKKDDQNCSPSQREVENAMCENLHGCDINKERILSYQKKAPSAPMGFLNPMRVLYTQTKTPASVKASNRYIPQQPDRILDAPDIVDDYYLNLFDWNKGNILAAALGTHVYLWDAGKNGYN